MAMSPQLQAAIAAHRFGLGEPDLGIVGRDAEGWLRGADRPGRPGARRRACSTRRAALRLVAEEREKRMLARNPPPGHDCRAGGRRPLPRDPARRRPVAPGHRRRHAQALRRAAALVLGQPLHRLGPQGLDARPGRRVRAGRDPAEHRRPVRDPAGRRDHPSGDAALPRQLALGRPAARGSSRCEARRAARRSRRRRAFPESTRTWPARCSSCTRSAPRARADGAYSQADVTAFAAVLSGWRVARDPAPDGSRFDANWHEPGRKTVLGKSYPEGPEALHAAASRPGPPSGHRPLRRHQAGAPLRRRRAAAGAGRPARRDLPQERRPARRPVPRADPPRGRLGHAAGQAEDARGVRRLDAPGCSRPASACSSGPRSTPPAPCSRSASG